MKNIKNFDGFVNESYYTNDSIQENYYTYGDILNEGWWEDTKTFLTNTANKVANKVNNTIKGVKNDPMKSAKSAAKNVALIGAPIPLKVLLGSKTGQNALKVFIDFTPAGIVLNMAKSAAKGDSTSFKKAWTQAKKYTKNDISNLEKSASNDMKKFGQLLNKIGIK